ncbi:MAG TPA: glycine/betaine ABC transporter [Candidatus Ligilactobacillus excrementipullorum]|nr:glycine/betaine ABC transporter [Candidatus Ligilactobacillus excrementipullorum]
MKRKLTGLLSSIAVLGLTLILTACGSKPAAYQTDQKLGPQLNYTITGIDASAGEMDNATQALDKYGLKKANWQLMPSSTAAMVSTLDKAVKYKQPIVVTAYQPHWMFSKYPLKWLKDPKNVFGKGEHESTVVRKGFKQDNPGAYQLLKNFSWDLQKDAEPVMMAINQGEDPTAEAQKYLKEHPQKVKEVLKGVPDGKGKKLKLVYMPYDYEIAASNVVSQLLKKKNYDVTLQQLDVEVMWQAIASDKADATVTAELPSTHRAFAKKYQGQYEIIRTNLKGARIGLAVPKYMTDINSIEDLKNH